MEDALVSAAAVVELGMYFKLLVLFIFTLYCLDMELRN